MPPGGWEPTGQACPREGCLGELLVKVLGGKHQAVRCNRRGCDYEKRERIKD